MILCLPVPSIIQFWQTIFNILWNITPYMIDNCWIYNWFSIKQLISFSINKPNTSVKISLYQFSSYTFNIFCEESRRYLTYCYSYITIESYYLLVSSDVSSCGYDKMKCHSFYTFLLSSIKSKSGTYCKHIWNMSKRTKLPDAWFWWTSTKECIVITMLRSHSGFHWSMEDNSDCTSDWISCSNLS